MKKFSNSYLILFSLLLVVCFYFKDYLPFTYIGQIAGSEVAFEANGLLVAVAILIIYKYLFKFKKTENIYDWKHIILLSVFPLYLIIVNILSLFSDLHFSDFENKSSTLITVLIVTFIQALSTSFFEEVIFRLGVINIIKNIIKNSSIAVVLISGIIFSCAHIVNFNYMPFGDVISQLIYSASLGFLFSTVYIISGKLWIPITFHFLLDWSGIIGSSMVAPSANNLFVEDIVILLASLLISIWVLKKNDSVSRTLNTSKSDFSDL